MIRLIRHAETQPNPDGSMPRDVPITENGARVASRLDGSFDLVICSTMKRARQTLDSSRMVYSEVIFTHLCREVLDHGVSNLYSGEADHVEDQAAIANRVAQFNALLREALKTHKKIAVVSHGIFLNALCGYRFAYCHYWDYYLPPP